MAMSEGDSGSIWDTITGWFEGGTYDGGGGGAHDWANDIGWQNFLNASNSGDPANYSYGRGTMDQRMAQYDKRTDPGYAQRIRDSQKDDGFREYYPSAKDWVDPSTYQQGEMTPEQLMQALYARGIDLSNSPGDSWWDKANQNKEWQDVLAGGKRIPGYGPILSLGQDVGDSLNWLLKKMFGGGTDIWATDPSLVDLFGSGGSGGFDMSSSGWVPPEFRNRDEMGGGGYRGDRGPTGGGREEMDRGGGNDPVVGGPGGGGGGNWPGAGGQMGPNTYGYSATGVSTSGPLQNQGGGAMPYGQQGGGAAAYDPFSPMNLWEPMSKQMDYNAARQNAALKEKFGAQGLRWSSPMMSAQQQLGRQTNEDQQRLMSQLMYQGAQDTYGRQKDSAQMQMQLGQMQDQRDAQLSGQLFNQGMAEQGMSNQDLAAYYQEYLRMNPDYISQLLGSMVGPYSGQFQRQKNSADEYAPWLAALASGLGSYYGSQGTKTT
jgi:hypothetical protein